MILRVKNSKKCNITLTTIKHKRVTLNLLKSVKGTETTLLILFCCL